MKVKIIGIILFIIFVFIIGYFYRRYILTKDCSDKAVVWSVQQAPESKYPSVTQRTLVQSNLEGEYFRNCLKSSSLNN